MWSAFIVSVREDLYHELFEEEVNKLRHYVPSLENAEIFVHRGETNPEFGCSSINAVVQFAELKAFKAGKDKADFGDLLGKLVLVVDLSGDRSRPTLGLHNVNPFDPNKKDSWPCTYLEFVAVTCSEIAQHCPSMLKEGIMICDSSRGEIFRDVNAPFKFEKELALDDSADIFEFQSTEIKGVSKSSVLETNGKWDANGIVFLTSKIIQLLLSNEELCDIFSSDGVDRGSHQEKTDLRKITSEIASNKVVDSAHCRLRKHLSGLSLCQLRLHGVVNLTAEAVSSLTALCPSGNFETSHLGLDELSGSFSFSALWSGFEKSSTNMPLRCWRPRDVRLLCLCSGSWLLVSLNRLPKVAHPSLDLMSRLDQLAANAKTKFECCRALSAIAEMCYARAKDFKGPRSGPAKNIVFQKAMRLLHEETSFSSGVFALAVVRDSWAKTPRNYLRLARQYDRAVQAIISDSVCRVSEHIGVEKSSNRGLPEFGAWVSASCPARIDLAGGWTDTPPICCDFGGKVCGVAITVDGKRPIGSKTKRISTPLIRIVMKDRSGSEQTLDLKEFCDIEDYNVPSAPGSLIKACVVYSQMVPKSCLEDEEKKQGGMEEFLMKTYGGGFEIHSWSDLPEGSGMGTSSILAGCIMATLWTAMGWTYSRLDLIHAVLMVEQYLTTGGGWQDQVNGLLPGIKLGSSLKSESLEVTVEVLDVEKYAEFFDRLQSHIVLVFTGEVRLAKNLLQDVIRQWYIGSYEIPDALKANYKAAENSWEACKKKDISGVGKHLREIWSYKKILAKGAETPVCKTMFEACRDLTYGESLAGAGGGGFMVLITKEPGMRDKISQIVQEKNLSCTCHDIAIDREGIRVFVGEEELPLPLK